MQREVWILPDYNQWHTYDTADVIKSKVVALQQGCPNFFSFGAKKDNLKRPVGQHRRWRPAVKIAIVDGGVGWAGVATPPRARDCF